MGNKEPDVVIILGGGTDKNLTPILYTKERLEAFVRSIRKFAGVPVIVSGGYSTWKKARPRYTESDVMRHYLVEHAVPRHLVYSEGKSRDTVGNAYYCKQIVKKHKSWKSLLVLTTRGHIARSVWIFKKVFGRPFRVSFWGIPSQSPYFVSNPVGRKKYEEYLIGVYKKLLKTCSDGDESCIWEVMKKNHPAYSNAVTARQLLRKILEKKQHLMGYTSPNT